MNGDDKSRAPDEENLQGTEEEMRRGQAGTPKRDVTIPLDEDVLRQMQALGPNWEGKVNDVLREWLEVARGR